MDYKGFALYQQNEEGKFVLVNEKQVIKRADGITYERKTRNKKYDKKLEVKMTDEEYNMVQTSANYTNKTMAEVIRCAIDDYFGIGNH